MDLLVRDALPPPPSNTQGMGGVNLGLLLFMKSSVFLMLKK